MPTLALRNTETSAILQSFDWDHHALGLMDAWPETLRFAVQLCLNSQFPICMTWGAQHYQIYNDGYIPILGDKHPAHFGRPAAETWPEIWEFLAPELDKIRNTGESAWFEDFLLPLVKSDVPQECYFTFCYSPLHGTSGRVEGVISIAYDSTAAYIARRRTALMADLVAATSSSVSVADLWSSVRATLRTDPMEFGQAVIFTVDGEGRPAGIDDEKDLQDALPINEIARQLKLDSDGRSTFDETPRMIALPTAGNAYVIPIRGRHNNILAVIHINSDPLCARDASYIRLLRQVSSTIEDALHRIQAHAAEIGSMQAALAEKESLYRSLLEATLDGVFFSYPDGTILEANQAAGEMLGYDSSEWRRLRRGDLFPVDDPALRDALRQRGETGRFSGELRMRRKDGTIVDVDLSSTILKDSSGTSVAVTIFRDITQRKEIQHRAEQSQKMEAIGQLTGGIAHDFNNLLTVILGGADDLETSEILDPRQREKAGMIRSAAETASTLISQLLAFARQEPLITKRTDINQCVENTVRLLGRVLGGKIDLVVDLTAQPPSSFVLVDPQQLELAIVNLALNSREAMPGGGILTITTGSPGKEEGNQDGKKYIAITVRDTGVGIPKEILPRIFEPFFTTKQRGQQGLGLGLSMVYGFVRQCGGSVRVDSEPGAGTAITILLPVTPEDMPNPTAPESTARHKEMAILLVDDNDLVREHIATQLLALGFRVQTAGSGDQALKVLEEGDRIDILLSDIVMPGEINGLALAEKARQLRPDISILLSSGYQGSDIDEAVSAFPVLRKPYRIGELRAAIDSVLIGKI